MNLRITLLMASAVSVALSIAPRVAVAQRVDTVRVFVPAEQPPIAKDPALAGVLSFVVTGAGQMYAGKPAKGITLLLLSVGGAVIAANSPAGPLDPKPTWGQIAGVGLSLSSWIYAIATAPGDAMSHNRRQR